MASSVKWGIFLAHSTKHLLCFSPANLNTASMSPPAQISLSSNTASRLGDPPQGHVPIIEDTVLSILLHPAIGCYKNILIFILTFHDNQNNNLPSSRFSCTASTFMPAPTHLLKRQNLQWFLVFLSIKHSPVLSQQLYSLCNLFLTDLLKNP